MARVKGLDRVLMNLTREIQGIEGRSLAGLRRAALFIQGEAQEITPQKTGTLVNSAFSGAEMGVKGPIGRVGYTAKYAPAVHEMPEGNNFTKPDTGPEFLAKAVRSNQRTVVDIIRRAARVD